MLSFPQMNVWFDWKSIRHAMATVAMGSGNCFHRFLGSPKLQVVLLSYHWGRYWILSGGLKI